MIHMDSMTTSRTVPETAHRDHPRWHRNPATGKQDCTRADGHQGLEDEAGVEADTIQRPDAARRRVGEEPTVKQHDATDEVETEEHGQRQQQVDGHLPRAHRAATRLDRRPREIERSWERVYGADGQFDAQLNGSLSRHGDSPVIDTVVDGE